MEVCQLKYARFMTCKHVWNEMRLFLWLSHGICSYKSPNLSLATPELNKVNYDLKQFDICYLFEVDLKKKTKK